MVLKINVIRIPRVNIFKSIVKKKRMEKEKKMRLKKCKTLYFMFFVK